MADDKADDKTLAIDKGSEQIETDFLSKVNRWKHDSESHFKRKHARWAKNMRLVNGIFEADEESRSKIRNRSKIFFRKTWATNYRILATLYQAFLKDPDAIKIEGRMAEDYDKADVLTEMVKYRRDLMISQGSLFRKLMWAMLDILNLGDTIGKMRWDMKQDMPDYVTYSPDRVFPDPYATTKENARYWIFESYLTRSELEERGFGNLNKIKPSRQQAELLKQSRAEGSNIPANVNLDDPESNYYPPDGSGDKGFAVSGGLQYAIWEILYKKDNEVHYSVTNEKNAVLVPSVKLPFSIYPIVHGSCLLVAHELYGEGFPEPFEGPQMSANATLNMRKDAVALSLAPHSIVSRYGGVDLESLINRRIGGITLVDDINAIREEDKRDVTGRAYMEVEGDDLMMQEMGGITAQRQGLPGSPGEKATVANIAYQESGTKLDLYIGTVSEFFRDFYMLLAMFIQKFETDATVIKVANAKFPDRPFIYDIDTFTADFIVKVGTPSINKQMEINQTMLAMDRATQANNITLGLVQSGALPMEQAKVFDVASLMVDLLKDIGKKNVEKYLIALQQPQQLTTGGQMGSMPPPANMMQMSGAMGQ